MPAESTEGETAVANHSAAGVVAKVGAIFWRVVKVCVGSAGSAYSFGECLENGIDFGVRWERIVADYDWNIEGLFWKE